MTNITLYLLFPKKNINLLQKNIKSSVGRKIFVFEKIEASILINIKKTGFSLLPFESYVPEEELTEEIRSLLRILLHAARVVIHAGAFLKISQVR
jgi:hypothetical protein